MTSPVWKSIAGRLVTGLLAVGLIAALIWSLAPHDPNALTAQLKSAAATERDLDPDRPGFISGLIDEQEYMRLRGDYLAERRGLPYGKLAEPREQALRAMTQQEALRPQAATANQWEPVGPAPIPNGQTSNRTDPVSGRTIAIAVHPFQGGI